MEVVPMHPLSKPKIDLTGARVGRLRILSYSQASDSRKAWVCLCDCGATVEIRGVNLRSGKTKSCGCLKAERMAEGIGKRHGMYGTRENKSWSTMIERCTNPKAKSYPDYGGRGITVCERWLSFENFFADMGPRPEGSTLDRKENSLGYEPDNCKWSTAQEQQNNRRNSRRYMFQGKPYTSLELSEISGISYHALRKQLGNFEGDVMKAVSKYGITSEGQFKLLVDGYEEKLRSKAA